MDPEKQEQVTSHSPNGSDGLAAEKTESLRLEDAKHVGAHGDRLPQHVPRFSKEEEDAVIRKLDWYLMPLIFALYMLSVLDRSNLGNARIAGLAKDINLTGRRYDWLATVFYIAYILSQWTTIGWKAFPPHKWVAVVVFLWGLVSTMQSTVFNWGDLMACRVLLGIVEACYGPGVPLYLSYFYPREKLGFRTGIFLSGSALANAYSGALAYGITQEKSHVAPWRILFIVEGVPTCLLAILAWFWFPDKPGDAWFLTERQREIVRSILVFLLLDHSLIACRP